MAASRNKSEFTERQMVQAFLMRAKSARGLPGLGRFWKVLSEVNCHRGRPDLVALPICQRKHFRDDSSAGWRFKITSSAVLALLEGNRPRTLKYIVDKTGLSRRSVTSALNQLVVDEYVSPTTRNTFKLANAAPLFNVQTWAFEFKLDKPKRAIFQAQQYRAFANHVMIVVPPKLIARFVPLERVLERWKIGLASFDPRNGKFKVVRQALGNSPGSKQHQIYAMSRVLEWLDVAA